MVATGSVRVNKALVLDDLYVGPGARILAYLQPKAYHPSINVIQHPENSIAKVTEWMPNWTLVRKKSKNWLLIDKPPGLPSVSTRDYSRGTLVPFWLRKYTPRHIGSSGILVTSRLDVGTHGLLVVGRNSKYVSKHNDLLETRNIRKHYTAVVTGWHRPHVRVWEEDFKNRASAIPQWVTSSDASGQLNHDPSTATMEWQGRTYPFPRRSLGLWEHYLGPRSGRRGEIPDPPYGEIAYNDEFLEDWEHLRVPSSRERTDEYRTHVKLILEDVREATADSVALRPFPKRWVESLLQQARMYNEPLYEVDLELLTGKTHQIRTQLECEGLRIVGDWLYGSPYMPYPSTFALCCRKLEWLCPVEQKWITFDLRDTPPPTTDQLSAVSESL